MSQSLRIAFFVGSFPVISETFILRQITGLINLGHEVDIYADARAEPGTPQQPEVGKYRLLERTTFMDMPPESAPWEMPLSPIFGETWLPGATVATPNWERALHALPIIFNCALRSSQLTRLVLSRAEFGFQAQSLSALYRLEKLSRVSRKYDVLHAHFGPVGNSFRFARDLWQAPLVVSFHGYDFCSLPRIRGREMYEKLFAIVDAVTVNSTFTHEKVENLGCPAEKLHLLPVGLAPEQFEFRERRLQPGESVRFLTVARLVEIKGHKFAIRALGKLRERMPNIHYDIVGDGPLRETLKGLIKELRAENCITLHGALPGDKVRELMAAAHLFLLPSVNIDGDQEGQGLALQEAQAGGLPVVATQHGALPEGMIPGKTGLLAPERDVDALVDRLQFLINHAETWAEMGQAGREFVVSRYDVGRLNQRLAELYESVKMWYEQSKTRP